MNLAAKLSSRTCAVGAILFFLLSRIAIYRFVPFRFERLGESMQLLDLRILTDDLFNGLSHLHSQPPLYNLLTGLFLKIVPTGMQSITLALLYSALGLMIMLGTYRLMTLRGIRPWIAACVAALLSVSPIMVWAERIPSYLYPIVALLVLAALALWKFVALRRTAYGLLFLLAIGSLPLMRSFFHLIVWLVPIVVGTLVLAFKLDRRRFALYATVGGVFVALVAFGYVRNYQQFGLFSGSTWQGMNIAGVVSLTPEEDVRKLVDKGEVTRLALIPRFSDPGLYYRYYGRPIERRVPALDDTLRSTGSVNWNNRMYAEASREYQRNAFAIGRNYPLQAIRGLANGSYLFCSFHTYKLFNDPAQWWIPRRDSIVHTVMDVALIYIVPLCFAALLALAFVHFVRTSRSIVRRKIASHESDYPRIVCDFFMGYAIFYTVVIAIVAELGEQSLMRAQVEPFLAVLAGGVVERGVQQIRAKRERRLEKKELPQSERRKQITANAD